jgi:hypothetical protein
MHIAFLGPLSLSRKGLTRALEPALADVWGLPWCSGSVCIAVSLAQLLSLCGSAWSFELMPALISLENDY